MFYLVECHIKCEETLIEKLGPIIKSWNHSELAIIFRQHTVGMFGETPEHWIISGVFNESERNNVYSLPLIIEDLGGKAWGTDIKQIDKLPD